MSRIKFIFPKGYHDLHRVKIMDFQLNRWHSLGYLRLEDLRAVAPKIKGFADWKRELVGLAEAALREQRMVNAAFCYRAAEFFVMPDDPDKEILYEKFVELFDRAFAEEGFERFSAPYANTFLPGFRLKPATAKKGVIVMHGGFDSFIEEFYSIARFFADAGYEVVGFEGPGQGAALKRGGLALNYAWEKPTKAILDYLKLEDVTLLGISLGGYLCFRAAAFESRIKRVIALSIAFDYMQIPPKAVQGVVRFLMRYKSLMNFLAGVKMKLLAQERWGGRNLMYITKTDTMMDAAGVFLQFNEANLRSDLVRQDVLILTGAEDHFIPLKMHRMQVRALVNARSVAERVFTREDQAQNHCMVGNVGLGLGVMLRWISEKGS